MRARIKSGFSLMEMMVVLLIVAIIAAASAPMVSKKMSRNAGSGDSPWVFTGLNNSVAFNMGGNDNATAIIGASQYTSQVDQPTSPRLVLSSDGDFNRPALAFANQNGEFLLRIQATDNTLTLNNVSVGENSVAIGTSQNIQGNPIRLIAIGDSVNIANVDCDSAIAIGQRASIGQNSSEAISMGYLATSNGQKAISIGQRAEATANNAIAIGSAISNNAAARRTRANQQRAIAIGTSVQATGIRSIAIGSIATASAIDSVAIGSSANASRTNSVALGSGATASGTNSVAIGSGVTANTDNSIVLGDDNSTVSIPGNLRVTGTVTMPNSSFGPSSSDRRLKNVGKEYKAGLEQLKQLEFFHYTFKKDESKTPRVGVMAQDLQKVFPNAVTKGDDGFLRIRWEDMFYAVINAVKELDVKIANIVNDITSVNKRIDEQQKVIESQAKLIEELQKQNADFEKRLKKLEGVNKK